MLVILGGESSGWCCCSYYQLIPFCPRLLFLLLRYIRASVHFLTFAGLGFLHILSYSSVCITLQELVSVTAELYNSLFVFPPS